MVVFVAIERVFDCMLFHGLYDAARDYAFNDTLIEWILLCVVICAALSDNRSNKRLATADRLTVL